MGMKISIIAGSNRKGASSTQVAKVLARTIQEQGHEVIFIDLYEKPMPLYSPDLSYANDVNVSDMKKAVLSSQAVVLATPEYHGSVSGVLKNALDFMNKDHFSLKPVLAVSSSGGDVGVSSLQQIQAIVRNLHGINCPEWLSVGGAQRSVFEQPQLDPEHEMSKRIMRVLGTFLALADQLSSKSCAHS